MGWAVLALIAGAFWIWQFTKLMALEDSDFPGRNDKALWVAAFIFPNILAAIAFYVWQKVVLAVKAMHKAGLKMDDPANRKAQQPR